MKKIIALTLVIPFILGVASPSEAKFTPTVVQVVQYSFDNCKNPDHWVFNMDSWKLAYPYKVRGAYVVFATTGFGIFNLGVTPYPGYAIVRPFDSNSKKMWVIEGCNRGYKTRVNYSTIAAGSASD